MRNDELDLLRKQLVSATAGRESHISFDKVVKDFPRDKRGAKPDGVPHSAWQLIEHMRIAQWDILEFSRDRDHRSPEFPDGYWPKSQTPENDAAWDGSIQAFKKDGEEFLRLLQTAELFAPFPHGDGQNLLREAIVVANHNSYHLGQLAFLKKMLEDS